MSIHIEDQQTKTQPSNGPLHGVRVIEFSALGPAPFACMLLSDMGAEVITVERMDTSLPARDKILNRGRTVVMADLKNETSRAEILTLLDRADILVESFRPGVMERLALGPDVLYERNHRLIYGRMSGYGQQGELAKVAGHDINFLAITGVLHAIGAANGPPAIPLNLVGDYAAGSLYLVSGLLAALHERTASGQGQIVDASITDGLFSLMSTYISHFQQGRQSLSRGESLLDGGAPFYSVYKTADNKYISVGAIEPEFFANLCARLGMAPELNSSQYDKHQWPSLKEEMRKRFLERTQEAWIQCFRGTDACFAPVLDLQEAMDFHHHQERSAFIEIEAIVQPAPALRFSRTPSPVPLPPAKVVTTVQEILKNWTRRSRNTDAINHD